MCNKSNIKKINSGFTLIEVLAAVFIIGTGLIGSLTLINQNISFIQINSSQLTAAYLAQEGIEIVKNIRDTNFLKGNPWDYGFTECGNGCKVAYNSEELINFIPDETLKIGGSPDEFYQYSVATPTFFQRKIIINIEGDLMKVKAEVFWTERGRDHEVVVEEHVYKWW